MKVLELEHELSATMDVRVGQLRRAASGTEMDLAMIGSQVIPATGATAECRNSLRGSLGDATGRSKRHQPEAQRADGCDQQPVFSEEVPKIGVDNHTDGHECQCRRCNPKQTQLLPLHEMILGAISSRSLNGDGHRDFRGDV
jgi:hypothetical protein